MGWRREGKEEGREGIGEGGRNTSVVKELHKGS